MGFGSTAKKLQSVVDMADNLYQKLNEVKEQMAAIRETIDTTNDRVGAIETELEEQREILEALAEAEGVEVPDATVETDDSTEDDATDQATGA
ncbi:Uncharacterized protein HSRCO_1297 [Halanaeroarchaeum sp. HSR-CO]|uniref:DUF5798 family protein n=1 Tax=Halanaeroarchaeum sp. HSR-CO TaxID=2866382 RepID=UPI00217CCE56|nr:DUF5798 family protein [Halanaeroarchaeum sp. HSR-CO]UWG47580.1 Uncharacterized protein HSRCO_1297 [Halanaeroarchaeum sp. HSR-CO]